ncbi:hypothetical protein [Pseudorhodobacter aquimaris]|uniref:hypothetical protein n=1 Tax=Pseudorhodobacter aquimaris TaxID=687412 RepID=UPI0012EE0EB4|nr:hypothetical protein [Pseudorhodobacter aquimaris]
MDNLVAVLVGYLLGKAEMQHAGERGWQRLCDIRLTLFLGERQINAFISRPPVLFHMC